QKFFALQFFDDMRARRAIWVPPAEVWLRVLLGDGMWLVLLLGGAAGLWLFREPRTENREPVGGRAAARGSWFSVLRSGVADARWVFVPWALYTLFTAMLFHTELRYRLPLYPVLLPYAAWALVRTADWRALRSAWRGVRLVGAALTVAALVGITLLHAPYLSESVML
ncbi:hypothetical protein SE17_44290, partial [Kouleothrix aurantiaca]